MVAELESRMARMAGKEAGLFCVSGTLANQLALRAHLVTCPPYSVVVEASSHVHCWEAGALAFHTGASSSSSVYGRGLALSHPPHASSHNN
jgi:threonine aldolase